jgi:hypothetical protein
MMLHEAIRLGAMLKPQAFGTQYDGRGTCANGAALDACGVLEDALRARTSVGFLFPITEQKTSRCPQCGLRSDSCAKTFGGLIAHLNDDHRWTREEIADWVQSVEEKDNKRIESARATNAVREATGQPVLTIRASSSSSDRNIVWDGGAPSRGAEPS